METTDDLYDGYSQIRGFASDEAAAGGQGMFILTPDGVIGHFGSSRNDGIPTGGGREGMVVSATRTTLEDTEACFPTAYPTAVPDPLAGCYVFITEGTGAGQRRRIRANTDTTLTLHRPWTTIPDATSRYAVGCVRWFRELVYGRAASEGGAKLEVKKIRLDVTTKQKTSGEEEWLGRLYIVAEGSKDGMNLDSASRTTTAVAAGNLLSRKEHRLNSCERSRNLLVRLLGYTPNEDVRVNWTGLQLRFHNR